MEITYEKIAQREMEQGVCLLTVTIAYPVLHEDTPAAKHINAYEKQYAETLASGLVRTALPARKHALSAHLAAGGRRSRFPTQQMELTGQCTVDVGRISWCFTLRTRCGGEHTTREGVHVFTENGILRT